MTTAILGTLTTAAWLNSPWQIMIVVIIILLLFGGKKLPELAKGLGKGMRTFKEELEGGKKTETKDEDQDVKKA